MRKLFLIDATSPEAISNFLNIIRPIAPNIVIVSYYELIYSNLVNKLNLFPNRDFNKTIKAIDETMMKYNKKELIDFCINHITRIDSTHSIIFFIVRHGLIANAIKRRFNMGNKNIVKVNFVCNSTSDIIYFYPDSKTPYTSYDINIVINNINNADEVKREANAFHSKHIPIKLLQYI